MPPADDKGPEPPLETDGLEYIIPTQDFNPVDSGPANKLQEQTPETKRDLTSNFDKAAALPTSNPTEPERVKPSSSSEAPDVTMTQAEQPSAADLVKNLIEIEDKLLHIRSAVSFSRA